MLSPIRKSHAAIKIMNYSLYDLPAPNNLSIWWNLGSMLGACLGIQIITGLLLAMHYIPHIDLAFSSIAHITRDVNYGWLLRNLHANSASMFFLCMYLHVGRGIYYSSFLQIETWNLGVILLIMVMATAFMGYVLPWGQMSFWAATVITNLFSAIPYIGKPFVEWLWGGFSVDNATLTRFFALHFLLPFAMAGVTMLHLLFLHQTGSNNPLGINSNSDKIPFHIYYTTKDIVGFIAAFLLLSFIILFTPNLLTDPENFIPANPLVTPVHIMPEWYFLWAYAILRAIPNKLGGVIALFGAILILLILPLTFCQLKRSMTFYPIGQLMFWTLVTSTFLLTWIGACPVEHPYELLGQMFTTTYFTMLLILPVGPKLWDLLLTK